MVNLKRDWQNRKSNLSLVIIYCEHIVFHKTRRTKSKVMYWKVIENWSIVPSKKKKTTTTTNKQIEKKIIECRSITPTIKKVSYGISDDTFWNMKTSIRFKSNTNVARSDWRNIRNYYSLIPHTLLENILKTVTKNPSIG